MDWYSSLMASSLSLARYWRIPLSDVYSMTYRDFLIAYDLAVEQVQEEERQSRRSSGSLRKVT